MIARKRARKKARKNGCENERKKKPTNNAGPILQRL